jgi:hypothetical protein
MIYDPVANELLNARARIRELETALGLAIEGHQIWESVYGSSPTSRAHLALLQAALKGVSKSQQKRIDAMTAPETGEKHE